MRDFPIRVELVQPERGFTNLLETLNWLNEHIGGANHFSHAGYWYFHSADDLTAFLQAFPDLKVGINQPVSWSKPGLEGLKD